MYQGMSLCLHILVLCAMAWFMYLPQKVMSKPIVMRVRLSTQNTQSGINHKVDVQKSQIQSKKKQHVQKKQPIKKVHIGKQKNHKSAVKLPRKIAKLPDNIWQQTHQQALDSEWQSMRASRQQDAIDKILQHIQAFWYVPTVTSSQQAVHLLIHTDAQGGVRSVKVKKRSGSAMIDQASIDAVWAASPLPMPDDNDISKDFRSFDLVMRPETITGIS